jgi:predicted NAD/FAD-dependent oxidoreductase
MVQPPRVAVVGGGIAGTLCSLVLKNRGIHPVLIDSGRNGVGGRLRNSGAQFLRATDPQLIPVVQMLQEEGLLAEWKGRFGLLGSSGGGFLPSEIVTNSNSARGGGSSGGGIMGLQPVGGDDRPSTTSGATDTGDFCHFVDGSRIPTYVGVPSMTELCPEICRVAGIEEINDARLLEATPKKSGGWSLTVENTDKIDPNDTFDALVLATHDPSLAGGVIRSIVDAETAAGGYSTVQQAMDAKDDASIVLRRLLDIANSMQRVRDDDRLPVYAVSITYPNGFSNYIPFDACSIPGSHVVQFLCREDSKSTTTIPNNQNGEVWTAITTSQLASTVLGTHDISDDEKRHAVSAAVTNEISNLMGSYYNGKIPEPNRVFVKRWGAAFCSKGLNLKENSIFLAPWRLSICGDFIRDISAHANPLETAALSGLEAGERTASLWMQTPPTSSQ